MLIVRMLKNVYSDIPVGRRACLCRGELVEGTRDSDGVISVKLGGGGLVELMSSECEVVADDHWLEARQLTEAIKQFLAWESTTSYNAHEVAEQAEKLNAAVKKWGLPT